MMKTIDLIIPRPGTSAVNHYLGFKDPCRLVAAYATLEVAQSATAPITLGKNGGAHTILNTDMDGTAARGTKAIPYTAAASQSTRNQIFDLETPIEIIVNLAADSNVHLQIVVDPFIIGPHKGENA